MHKKRHDQIVSLIEDLITSGKLRAGERIPPERDLAEKFGVSRNTVREAIKALAEKAVVVSRRGAGTFVAEGALGCMIDGVTRRRRRLAEIFELRKILEPQLARLAAQRITASAIAALEEIVKEQHQALTTGRSQVELDERFHRLVAGATKNSVLCDVYEKLHEVLAESRIRELQSPERNRQSLEHHRQLVQALKTHAADEATELMHRHMEQIEKNLDLLPGSNNRSR
jgi:GntR family transcriptional repressor for pyruvate dehydrogenase complex